MKIIEISGDRLAQSRVLDDAGGGWDRIYDICGHVKMPHDIGNAVGWFCILKIKTLDGEIITPELLILSIFSEDDCLEIVGWNKKKDGFLPVPFTTGFVNGEPRYIMIKNG